MKEKEIIEALDRYFKANGFKKTYLSYIDENSSYTSRRHYARGSLPVWVGVRKSTYGYSIRIKFEICSEKRNSKIVGAHCGISYGVEYIVSDTPLSDKKFVFSIESVCDELCRNLKSFLSHVRNYTNPEYYHQDYADFPLKWCLHNDFDVSLSKDCYITASDRHESFFIRINDDMSVRSISYSMFCHHLGSMYFSREFDSPSPLSITDAIEEFSRSAEENMFYFISRIDFSQTHSLEEFIEL